MRIDVLTPFIFKPDPLAAPQGGEGTLLSNTTQSSVSPPVSTFDSSTEHVIDFLAKRKAKLQMAAQELRERRRQKAIRSYKQNGVVFEVGKVLDQKI